MGGVGRFVDKSAARSEAEQKKKEEAGKIAAEEQATKAAQSEMAAIAAEQKPVPVSPEQIAQMQSGVINQRGTLNRELERLRSEAVKETDPDKLAEISGRAAQIQTGLNDLDATKVKAEISGLGKEINSLNKQIKAAEKKAPDTVDALKQTLEEKSTRLETLKAKLPALAEIKQEGEGQDYKNEMAKKLKQLDKAREAGDLEAVGRYARQYKDMQSRYQGVQGNLFEETKQGLRYPEAEKEAADKIRADLAAGKETAYQKALGAAEKAVTPKAREVIKPATEEDIAAQKEAQAKMQALQDSRDTMQKLFETANSTNDIEAAYQLRKLIELKDKEIEAAKTSYPKAIAEKYVGDRTREEDIALLKKYQEQVKEADDKLKSANPDKIYDAEGALTKYGESLVEAQKTRDSLLTEIPKVQERLDKANLTAGEEFRTTEQIAQAFPEKGGPDVDMLGKLNTLRKHVGAAITNRAAMMGLRRKLALARSAKDREGADDAINKMRALLTEAEETKDSQIDIPKDLSEGTKKYYAALNAARAKQDKYLNSYMDSVEALVNRDYIGGVTKKAKVTKGVLEKRVETDAVNFANAMLEEAEIHRRVAGAVPLSEDGKVSFRKQYAEALEEFKRLAKGDLAAPEAAKSVIADHIGEITYAAINEGMKGRFIGKTTREEPLLKTQFGTSMSPYSESY